jgi:hypothetical protein
MPLKASIRADDSARASAPLEIRTLTTRAAILKPSEHTSLTALRLAEELQRPSSPG